MNLYDTYITIVIIHPIAKLVNITRITVLHLYLFFLNIRITIWLVVWTMFYDFPYIGNVIIPSDELIFFIGVGIPPTSCSNTVQLWPFISYNWL